MGWGWIYHETRRPRNHHRPARRRHPDPRRPGWHWVRSWIFHHDGRYYDLSASNLDMLDCIATNGCSLVEREWALNG